MSGKHIRTAQAMGVGYWTDHVKNPTDPVGRLKLSGLLHHDDRASYKHHIIWQFHLDWSHQKYGNTSLASVRTVHAILTARSPTGKAPLSQTHIHAATRDLCEWGYIAELEKGSGRTASRYLVNWNLLDIAARGNFSVHLRGEHKDLTHLSGECGENQLSVHHVGDASVHPVREHKGRSVHPLGNEDPDTNTGLKDPVIGMGNVPPPQAADGLGATAPGEGFEEAWKAYRKYGDIKKSREAWKKIGPDGALAAHIARQAASWAASVKSGRRRAAFQNWLADERYDEADRRPVAANDNGPRKATPQQAPTTAPEPAPHMPVVKASVEIIEADLVDGGTLRLAMKGDNGEVLHDEITLESADEAVQRAGQKRWGALQDAVGATVEEPSELIGRKVVLIDDPYSTRRGYEPPEDADQRAA